MNLYDNAITALHGEAISSNDQEKIRKLCDAIKDFISMPETHCEELTFSTGQTNGRRDLLACLVSGGVSYIAEKYDSFARSVTAAEKVDFIRYVGDRIIMSFYIYLDE